MCHGTINFSKFDNKYGIDFKDYFADLLAKLTETIEDGLIEITDKKLVLFPQGHLMMRIVAMAFDAYLGESQKGQFSRTVNRKSARLNSSHVRISYAVFCLKKKKKNKNI